MITIYVNDIPLSIPTSWNDLTFGQYIEILSAKSDEPSHTIMMLTGINPAWWSEMYENEKQVISDLIGWHNNRELFDAAVLKAQLSGKQEQLPKINFEQEEFEKYQATSDIFRRSKKHPLYLAEAILNVYSRLSIMSDKVPAIWNECNRLLSDFEAMLKKYPDFKPSKIDHKAKLAGVDRFEAFGDYGTLATLSGFDPLKIREIKRLPTIEVLQLKSFLSLKNAFESDYASIRDN